MPVLQLQLAQFLGVRSKAIIIAKLNFCNYALRPLFCNASQSGNPKNRQSSRWLMPMQAFKFAHPAPKTVCVAKFYLKLKMFIADLYIYIVFRKGADVKYGSWNSKKAPD
jgi:hypothetical protein